MNVLLVDGSAIAYRSYFAFARAPLRSSRGEETSLVYGFLSSMLRWIERYRPEVAAVVFDAPGPTFRHAQYAAYKANRPAKPESFVQQLPRLHQVLEALRLPVLQLEGWEADDVIGTVARRFEARGECVYLVSSDKDFRQLVSERVRLVRPQGPLDAADEEIGLDELRATLGLEPQQVVDLMALSGDSTDNVPGVPGVGEKTAADLMRQHGTLENLYAHLEEVARPALRDRLAAGRDSAWMSRDLVRLETEAPVPFEPEALVWPGPDWPSLRLLLKELELFQVLRLLPPEPAAPRAALAYRLVRDLRELRELGRVLGGLPAFAIDVETTSIDPMRAELVAMSFAWEPGRACLVPVAAGARPAPSGQLGLWSAPESPGFDLETLRAVLGPALARPEMLQVGQNIKYDALVLAEHGMPLTGRWFDTMIASYVLNPARRQHGLQALALEFLDERLGAYEQLFDPGDRVRDIRSLPLERLMEYGCADADVTWRLYERLGPELERAGLENLFTAIEMPLARVLLDMERAGVQVDGPRLEALARHLHERAAGLAERLYELCGRRFNLNSPKQLGEVLFRELALPHGRRTRSGWSTDVDVLEKLAAEHEVGRLLLEYRQITKLGSTYAEALPKLVHPRTGRIHTRFNQAVATTGRLSSSDPNLQNIPGRTELGRRIRAAFVARDDDSRLVSADYSQIELRLMAHFSQDAALLQAFREGGDVHTLTAARIAGCAPAQVTSQQRAAAKTVNFGVLYGMGARGLAERLAIPVDEARRFISEYFESYPGVRRYTQEIVQRARAERCVTTLLGRRIPLADLDSAYPAQKASAERLAVNAPIQGSAADLVKAAMVRVQARLQAESLGARMILQVHDELVFDTPLAEVERLAGLVKHEMEAAVPLRVPVVAEVGVGRNWAEAH